MRLVFCKGCKKKSKKKEEVCNSELFRLKMRVKSHSGAFILEYNAMLVICLSHDNGIAFFSNGFKIGKFLLVERAPIVQSCANLYML